jgi:hypothetical protein
VEAGGGRRLRRRDDALPLAAVARGMRWEEDEDEASLSVPGCGRDGGGSEEDGGGAAERPLPAARVDILGGGDGVMLRQSAVDSAAGQDKQRRA